MDKIVKKLAPLGITGIVFIVAITSAMSAGLVGAAVFTSAMAALGPGGMIGGVVTLGVVGLISSVAVDYGYDAIVIAVIREQLKKESKENVWNSISKKRLISKDLKLKIKDYIEKS